ncbi:hypothetical protein F2Q69_00029122 [Brassica cretica]|uniref:Uncharacterized protein n=1 Tax=Brassica cretica TaxID=69181 RepID=A0A8S9S1A3_BRACR|nr:hypothetical protein F2Q69_00029122 [Brassica cretica]
MSRGSVSIDVWDELSIDFGWKVSVDGRVASVDGGEQVSVNEISIWVDGGWRISIDELTLMSIDEERLHFRIEQAQERTGKSGERREKIAPYRLKPDTLEFGCRSLSPSRETRERQERVVREEKRSLPYTDTFSNRMLPPVTKDQPKNILKGDIRLNFL